MSYPSFDLVGVDQLQVSTRPDLVPADASARRELARMIAFDGVVYGLPAVYQYAQMCRHYAVEGCALGAFLHERELARPGFAAFRVPNVDTLYSNAWLDLRDGPVIVDLPDFGDRYYTLNLLDGFGSASNISHRTIGDARQIWVLSPTDDTEVPADAVRLRVSSQLMWVLMRIQVVGDEAEVHRLQDSVVLRRADGGSVEGLMAGSGTGDAGRVGVLVDPDEVTTDWRAFFRGLDAALRLIGVPAHDLVIVRRLSLLGLTGENELDLEQLDPEVRAGAEAGFAEAMKVIDACRPQLGEPIPTGWTKVRDKGAHGVNYLSRAVMSHVGLGANVVEENTSFNTYADVDGRPLDGSSDRYEVRLDTPPPAGAFWSVTMYDGDGFLVPNPIGRYAVGSATSDLVVDDDGSVTIAIQPEDGGETQQGLGGARNWLPSPRGRFFLVLRIYRPGPDALSGAWLPGGVRPVSW